LRCRASKIDDIVQVEPALSSDDYVSGKRISILISLIDLFAADIRLIRALWPGSKVATVSRLRIKL
jgi:hypothetical protein